MNFINLFKKNYFNLCNPKTKKWITYNTKNNLFQRGEGFLIVFDLLSKQNKSDYKFIETGVLRKPNNWIDGQSTFLFQEFLKSYNGKIFCVDISEDACTEARNFLDPRVVSVTCDDSLNFLKNLNLSEIDFFHLDSYDVKWKNDEPSADHHLKEFLIIEPHLKPGSIVMIDDNTYVENARRGKGRKIYEYLSSKNIFPLYDNYQIIYQF